MASTVEVLTTPRVMSPETDGEGIACAHRAEMPDGGPQETDPPPVPGRQRNWVRVVFVLLGAAALVTYTAARRAALVESIAVLGHLRWIWVPVALGLEWSSMSTFARMQRQLLKAGGATVEAGTMLATAYGANALSTSVPLAGPELGAAFTFGRFRLKGVDPPLAGWSLIVGGVLSAAAGLLVLVGGALVSGNDLLALVGVLGGVLGAAAVVVLHTAARHPQLRSRLALSAAWTLGRGRRLLRRSIGNPTEEIRAWIDRLASLHPGPSIWMGVSSLALANWLTDAGVLAASIYAVGAPVPWRALLLVYGSGAVVRSLGITPGGLGLAEGTLCLGLVGAGLHSGSALASVLLYRVISFWMVAAAGWVVLLCLRGDRRADSAILQRSIAS